MVTFLTNGYHSTWESITVLCHALSTDWFCRGNIPGLKRQFQLFILTISTVKWKLNLGAIFIKFCEFLRSKGLFLALCYSERSWFWSSSLSSTSSSPWLSRLSSWLSFTTIASVCRVQTNGVDSAISVLPQGLLSALSSSFCPHFIIFVLTSPYLLSFHHICHHFISRFPNPLAFGLLKSRGPCLHFIALIPCHYHRLNETGDTYIWNRFAIKRKIVAKLAKSLLARVRMWWRQTTINYKWENCRKAFRKPLIFILPKIPEWWILTCLFETRGFLTLGMLWKKTRTPKDQTCWQNWENILREATMGVLHSV